MATVVYHRLAEQELNDAAQFYEFEQPGLGRVFLDEIRRCAQLLVNLPESGPVVRSKTRRKLVRRFPYALLYSIQPDGIRILAVMNLKRRPMYWIGRK